MQTVCTRPLLGREGGRGGGLGTRLGHNMLIMKELPHELVQSDSDGTHFSNDMREKVPVSSDSRVTFQETLCEVVDKNA